MAGKKVRVLIIDDSALMRQLIREILESDPGIEVVGSAGDPYAAREKILALNPDVLTLDVEMPRMDGITFLEKLMAGRPMPVVMLSSLTEAGCSTTMRALELGAVDFVSKPKIDLATGIMTMADEIIDKVKAAATAHVRPNASVASTTLVKHNPVTTSAMIKTTHKVIAIGGSTGGTEALCNVLASFPPDAPGVVAVLHMPEGFTKSYAQRLDRTCQIRVKEAEDGDRILPGHAILAAGNFHMGVVRSGASYQVRVFSSVPVQRHRPSVDVLFNSCAETLGTNAVGVILTGMGADGADGLLAMKNAGAKTIAQDEQTCVVFGMPKEAIARNAANHILPLDRIAPTAIQLANS